MHTRVRLCAAFGHVIGVTVSFILGRGQFHLFHYDNKDTLSLDVIVSLEIANSIDTDVGKFYDVLKGSSKRGIFIIA